MDKSLQFCFNIEARNDEFYETAFKCQPFTRSDAICTDESVRTQFNALSSYIDASMIYGSDELTATRLRSNEKGEMLVHEIGPTLPTRKQCGFSSNHGENPRDLVGGDVRAIEQPGLASMHSLFVSEHNRIARQFSTTFPTLSDEDIYQISRKIVTAEIQNIVYSEFLPVVLGKTVMETFKLNLPSEAAQRSIYNDRVDPTISNEFATVAFRFGHSLIPNLMLPSRNPIRSNDNCPLKDNFFKFEEFVMGSDKSGKAWQNLLVGMLRQESPAMDASMSHSVIDFLFCKDKGCRLPGGFGQDLASRNIQRGRDHGLPSYMKFREFCGLDVQSDWLKTPAEISRKNWNNLKEVYEKVADIDAFSGGLSEEPVEGGLIGPTFACILGIQFSKLKEGDRFFFTHSKGGVNNEQGLSAELKAVIRKRTLGDIICDNAHLLNSLPKAVMDYNPSVEEEQCSTRPDINFAEKFGWFYIFFSANFIYIYFNDWPEKFYISSLS